MTELEPMNSPTLLCVLSMIAPRWAPKARVVAFVGSFEGGAWLSARDVAETVGRDERRCNTILNELEAERVVLRAHQAGRRPGWCEVNPDVRAWRGVPWVLEPATVEARLSLLERQRQPGAIERLVARPYGARQGELIARLYAARQGADSERYRAAYERAMPDPLSRVLVRALTAAPVTKSRSFVGRGASSVVVDTAGAERTNNGDGHAPHSENYAAARRAILRRAALGDGGRLFLEGRPRRVVEGLLERFGLEPVLGAVEATAPDQVPGMVTAIADLLERPAVEAERAELELEADADRARRILESRRQWLQARAVSLRDEAELCDREGANNVGDTYRAELEGIEAELAGVAEALELEEVAR